MSEQSLFMHVINTYHEMITLRFMKLCYRMKRLTAAVNISLHFHRMTLSWRLLMLMMTSSCVAWLFCF